MSLANEDVTVDLDRLAELHAAATPGPWTPATAPSADSSETHAEYLVGALRPDEGRPLWVAWAPVVDGLHDSDYVVPVVAGDGPTSEANARFVANAHDAIPRLLAAIRAAYGLAEEMAVLGRELHSVVAADAFGDAAQQIRAVLDEALEVPGA